MAFGVQPSRGWRSEINVTPLVDIVLVLLIIFMVVTPMLEPGQEIVLPNAGRSEEGKTPERPIVVSVAADKALWFEHKPVRDDDLERSVAAALREHPARTILLKADARLKARDIRRVLKRIQAAGARSVGLGVEDPKGPGDPR